MQVAAAILLVASGCSLVMSRPASEEAEVNEPVVVHGPILPSAVFIGRDVTGVWKVLSNKWDDIKQVVVKPAVNGVLESADAAKGIFADTVRGITTSVLKPITAVANGVSNKVDGIQVTVVKPAVGGLQVAGDGALYIFHDTVSGLNTAVLKPAINAAHHAASGTLEFATDTAVVINSGLIQMGVDALYNAANNAMGAFHKASGGINSGSVKAFSDSDAGEEAVIDI